MADIVPTRPSTLVPAVPICKEAKQVAAEDDPTPNRVQFHYCRRDKAHVGKHRCACSHEWGAAAPNWSPHD